MKNQITIQNFPKDKKIILFDGVCNLCDQSVQLIIKNDSEDVFRFVSIQSETGKQLIDYIGIDIAKVDSIILYEPGKAYYFKSEAAFRILKHLKGWFIILNLLGYLPRSFTNFMYDFIAKNRYKWYGKKESCLIPNESLKSKFL